MLRPFNLLNDAPGKGFGIYNSRTGSRVGVLNLMGNIFMKKCEDVFKVTKNFLDKNKLKDSYDFLCTFRAQIPKYGPNKKARPWGR